MNYLEMDKRLFLFINHRCHNRVLDRVMPWFTWVGGINGTLLVWLVFVMLPQLSERKALLALLFTQAVAQFSKRLTRRLRPYLKLSQTKLLEKLILRDYSFPSAHTASSCCLLPVVAMGWPAVLPLFLFLSLGVAFSRIYLGMHYPSDVLAGIFVGLACGCLAIAVPWN